MSKRKKYSEAFKRDAKSVRWYLRYALSYRDLEEILAERGLSVDHTTIFRWVQAYAPEIDRPPPSEANQRFMAGG